MTAAPRHQHATVALRTRAFEVSSELRPSDDRLAPLFIYLLFMGCALCLCVRAVPPTRGPPSLLEMTALFKKSPREG